MDISTRLCSRTAFEPSSSRRPDPASASPPPRDESVPSSTSTSVNVRVPRWYRTSPTLNKLRDSPRISVAIKPKGLPNTLFRTLSLPRCAIPTTTASAPPAAALSTTLCNPGMSASAPSNPNRFADGKFRARNPSSASALISLLSTRRLSSRVSCLPAAGRPRGPRTRLASPPVDATPPSSRTCPSSCLRSQFFLWLLAMWLNSALRVPQYTARRRVMSSSTVHHWRLPSGSRDLHSLPRKNRFSGEGSWRPRYCPTLTLRPRRYRSLGNPLRSLAMSAPSSGTVDSMSS